MQKEAETNALIMEEKKKLERITDTIGQLSLFTKQEQHQLDDNLFVSMKSIPSFQVLSLRKTIDNYFCEEQLWYELGNYVKKHSIYIEDNQNTITFFHDTDHRDTDVDVEVAVVVTETTPLIPSSLTYRTIPEEKQVASVLVQGPFSGIGKAYMTLANWLEQHPNYQMKAVTRQICHRGPWDTKDEEDYLTEVQIPLNIFTKPKR